MPISPCEFLSISKSVVQKLNLLRAVTTCMVRSQLLHPPNKETQTGLVSKKLISLPGLLPEYIENQAPEKCLTAV